MTRLRRLPPALLPVLAVLLGFVAAMVGLYLLVTYLSGAPVAGLAASLLAGGVVLAVGGLLVDI